MGNDSKLPISLAKTRLWLRCETNRLEKRTPLTPAAAKKLIEAGLDVAVEEDPKRIFDIEEYKKVGCEIKTYNSWPNAPPSAIIIGLEELPASLNLIHTHLYLAHCYKDQAGWKDKLSRFSLGGGALYDLEYLKGEDGRSVVTSGYHAGFVGAAIGLLALAARKEGEEGKLGGLDMYSLEEELVKDVEGKLLESGKKLEDLKVLILGALGNCGSGALELLLKVGLAEKNILKWNKAETLNMDSGQYSELLGVDILLNCIYLSGPISPFLSLPILEEAGHTRRLSVVVDVSCDNLSPFNPLPIYKLNTTFENPTLEVPVPAGTKRLDLVSIDHLPALLPLQASEKLSNGLLPALLTLPRRHEETVWTDAESLFKRKLREAGLN